jgi:glycosyltransferase involved in cell wall biosynthesis
MRITFVLPEYLPHPIGGYRIVFGYANFLAAKGHTVTIVFPRELGERQSSEGAVELVKRKLWASKVRLRHRPLVNWQWIDPRVKLLLLPRLNSKSLPAGDAIIATAWQTADPVMGLPALHGEKYYLIQHYETWAGPKLQVDATWRLPMRLVVIAEWLYELGVALGARSLRHIPNAIDHSRFQVLKPPVARSPHVISLYHNAAFKGVPDALDVLARFHLRHPEIPVTMFGTPGRGTDIPRWIQYHQSPSQDLLVRGIYNEGTVYLSASLAEGWALPPAEAMACGCAFVGTDIGGFRDYAKDGITALLTPPHDRDALLTNLYRIIDDRALAASIQERGTAFIQQFTWERSGSMLEEYLAHH